jgi:hypothetical protein
VGDSNQDHQAVMCRAQHAAAAAIAAGFLAGKTSWAEPCMPDPGAAA